MKILIQDQIASMAAEMASVSARLAKVEDKTASNSAQLALQELLLPSQEELFRNVDIATISAEFAKFSDSLTVIGNTQLAQTTIGGSLQVGLLHFDDMKAEISSLTGQVTINSNLNVMGDVYTEGNINARSATVSGQLKAKTVETDGISLKDEATGEYYCVRIKNGEFGKVLGKCQ